MAEVSMSNVTAWHELMSQDPRRAETFYGEVLGYTTAPLEGSPYPYTMWMRGGQPVGGLVPPPAEGGEWPSGSAPHWVSSFVIEDVDRAAGKTAELGGEVLVPPVDVPGFGRAAVLKDAEGAVFGVFQQGRG